MKGAYELTLSSSTPPRVLTSGRTSSMPSKAELFEMQDEIVTRLARALQI